MKTIRDDERMTPAEFIDLGLLQEINRRVLHPAGVNLELSRGGTVRIFQLPEGSGGYRFERPNGAYAETVDRMVGANASEREAEFRDVIQPIDLWESEPCGQSVKDALDALTVYKPDEEGEAVEPMPTGMVEDETWATVELGRSMTVGELFSSTNDASKYGLVSLPKDDEARIFIEDEKGVTLVADLSTPINAGNKILVDFRRYRRRASIKFISQPDEEERTGNDLEVRWTAILTVADAMVEAGVASTIEEAKLGVEKLDVDLVDASGESTRIVYAMTTMKKGDRIVITGPTESRTIRVV